MSARGTVGDHHAVLDWLSLLVGIVLASLRDRHDLVVENLLLRQQLSVAARAHPHPRLRRRDRLFWVWLSRCCTDWRSWLTIVKPETVVR